MSITARHRARRPRRPAVAAVAAIPAIVAAPLLGASAAEAATDFDGWSFSPTALCNSATGSVQAALLAQSDAGYSDTGPAPATVAWQAWVRMDGGQWNLITGDQAGNGWETGSGRTVYSFTRDARWGHGTYEVYVEYAIATRGGWQVSSVEPAEHYATTGYQDTVFATGTGSCTA